LDLVFIYGPPASGKLTVANELAKLTGYKVFHNHLAVDLASAVFEFGSAPFVRIREYTWMEVFREAALADRSLIFTFTPEITVRPKFLSQSASFLQKLDSRINWIELTCAEEELFRRLGNEDRTRWGKLDSVEEYQRLKEAGAFEYPMPVCDLSIDSAVTSAPDAARQIYELLKSPARQPDPLAGIVP
jgi:hypothetical protein